MGCWAIGGPFTRTGGLPMGWGDVDDAESIRAIHAAIDRGVTLFDTANNYGAGHSERVLGQALAGRRDKVRIATKFGSVFDEETRQHFDVDNEIDEAFIRDALEGSLRRLNTDYIDLYQLHDGSYPVEKAPAVRETLETLVREGKIGAYGWSTDHPDRAEVFAPGAHCVSIQFSLNLFRRNPDMLALCDRHGLAAINKHPLASGFLTGKFKADTTFPENDLRHGLDLSEGRGALRLRQIDAIRDILTAGGRTPAQGALGWLWAVSDRTIPIPGFKSVKQVEDNAGALAHGPLSAAQVAELETILAQFQDAA
jgi:aryl-alcohol dehydrogenase-like predicted oxidoreductase